MSNKKLRGLIFDMDGTLIQNMPWHRDAFRILAQRLNFEYTQVVDSRFFGWHNHDIFRAVTDEQTQLKYGVDFLHKQKEAIYRETYAGSVKLTDGLDLLLRDAKRCGVKCYIGSASPKENADFIMEQANLYDLVEGYVCCDDVPLDKCKPDPEIFLLSARRMGLDIEECIVFEDAPSGVKAGKRSKAPTVALSVSGEFELLSQAGADMLITSFEGLTIDSLEKRFFL
ncbi:MAG: HAD family phosphatase [Alistipes sp.]|nr:HAD family phosphatase [Candidatus Alistipes equi]